ncbi:MAG: hypothetical protein AAGA62_17480, partial [Bacteroidota bacterium]
MNQDQQRQFDENLRASLNELQPDFLPGSWDRLAQRLGDASVEGQMDEHIRQSLNGLEPAYRPESWGALRAQLDHAETDEIIHQRLSNAEPVYQPSSWPVLAARLELIAQRRAAVAAYKFSELCLMLSALLLLWNFFVPQVVPAPVLAEQLPEPVTPPATVASSQYEEDIVSIVELPQEQSLGTSNNAVQASDNIVAAETVRSEQIIAPLPVTTASLITLEEEEEIMLALANTVDAVEAIPTVDQPLLGSPRTAPAPALSLRPAVWQKPSTYLRLFVSPWDFNQVVTPAFNFGDKIIE